MGAYDAPGWLLPAYIRSMTALGATAGKERLADAGRALLERWSSPDRHFHGVSHLIAVLERVDELAQETHHPDLVRVAAWYHGVEFDSTVHRTYNRAVGEDKPASAAHAHDELRQLGVPDRAAERVRALIQGLTRHDADPSDVDALALCDADLGILAVEPQRYKEYRQKVRQEFSHVSARDYAMARSAVVTQLLARERIFLSPLAEPWEAAARQNLAAELARLAKELRSLPDVPKPSQGDDSPAAAGSHPEIAAAEPHENRPPGPRIPTADADGGETEVDTADIGDAESEEADALYAECVGVPFADRPKARPKHDDMGWGIERAPSSARDIPRRDRTIAGQRGPTAMPPARQVTGSADPGVTGASAISGASPETASPERASTRPSTESPDDDASTGSLFRPSPR